MNRQRLKTELQRAFSMPGPDLDRKREFLNHLEFTAGAPRAGRGAFIRAQAGYIRKRVWILSLLLFLLMTAGLLEWGLGRDQLVMLFAMIPFLALFCILELARSTSFGMAELELGCLHTLGEVVLIRMGILGGYHGLFFLAGIAVLHQNTGCGLLVLAFCLLTPFLITCLGSLFLLNRFRIRDALPVCAGVAGAVSIITMFAAASGMNPLAGSPLLGLVFVLALAAGLVMENTKFLKRMEELQWNWSSID